MVIDLFSFVNGKHIMYVQTDESLFSVQKTRYTFLHTLPVLLRLLYDLI